MGMSILIYVVDDDPELLGVIAQMLKLEGVEHRLFHSPQEFLALDEYQPNSCLVLDNHMPGYTGLDLQNELNARKASIPIVFISGDSTTQDVVAAVKNGAYQFLQKPFKRDELISSINEAVMEQQLLDAQLLEKRQRQEKLASLTPRETELLDLLCLGHSNKSAANELGITNSTVEFHRSNLNTKLGAKSLADLILIYRDISTTNQ